jgi:undecaprenyl-diphosphatase
MLDQLLTTIILGLIQGLAEWLPISSMAHLKLAETFLGLAATPLFNLVLHLGTLTVVIFFFRKEVKSILVSLVRLDFKSENGKLIPLIIVATIPTAIIGLTYDLFLQNNLETIPVIAVTFIIGATIVYSTKFAKENVDGLSYKIVILMGVAQGFAIFPGLSRSGVTISAALLLGLKREKAFQFSFLMSIPAILGDFALEAYSQRGVISTSNLGLSNVIAGLAAAIIIGYLALRLVSSVIRGKKFHYFSFYTAIVGAALLIWFFIFQ